VTPAQMQTMNATLRRLEAKIDRVDERLTFVYPTDREMRVQIDDELNAILGDGAIRVFADD
jgi:hypothetical protein